MGIQGLLPMLQEIQQRRHISDFRGKRLAVDAYVWLHKGAFGCAEELVKGERTTKFVDYAMGRVHMLVKCGVTPYIVFDGGPLPAKKGTEVSRAKSREANMREAQRLENENNRSAARMAYTKCVDITPEMAYQFIKALRAENIDYVVAPYEADAQLCFLEREGYVDGIVTEDSDLLVFGCQQVIFKLDNVGGCQSIHRNDFDKLVGTPMHGWTNLEFRRMAMLSGCDYLPSIPGIGIKTAHKMLRRYKTVERLLQSLRLDGTYTIPPSYQEDFSQAELAFVYQRVFDPATKTLVTLNKLPSAGLPAKDEKWVGVDIDPHVARGMAAGDVHPETMERIQDLWPYYQPAVRPPRPGMGPRIVSAPISRGPMDAFVKRTPSMPLPTPIGTRSSGPSRLSDQMLYERKTLAEVNSNLGDNRRPIKTGKFFDGHRSAATQLEEAVQKAKEEIVWEKSDGPVVESQENETCVTAREARATQEDQRGMEQRREAEQPDEWVDLADFEDELEGAVTSPVASLLSSPGITPTKKRERPCDDNSGMEEKDKGPLLSSPPLLDNVFVFELSEARKRETSPLSPTRSSLKRSRSGTPVLDSLPEFLSLSAPAGQRVLVEETQKQPESYVAETPKISRLAQKYSYGSIKRVGSESVSRAASLQSVLVGPSSPVGEDASTTALRGSTSLAAMSSSDGVEIEIVTPSMDLARPGVRSRSVSARVTSSKRSFAVEGEANEKAEPFTSRPSTALAGPTATDDEAEAIHDFDDIQVSSSDGQSAHDGRPSKKAKSSSSQPSSSDPEDEHREQKAKAVAAGWRKKFEHRAAFPRPGSTRINKDSPAPRTSAAFGHHSNTPTVRKAKDSGKEWKDGEGMWHDSMFSPPPKSKTAWTTPQARPNDKLVQLPENVPPEVVVTSKEPLFTLKGMYGEKSTAEEAKTPVGRAARVARTEPRTVTKKVQEELRTPVRSPLSAFEPLKCSSLERFRFKGKAHVTD